MIVFLTLTTAGSDTGPFDLYSDLDGFITPFETGVDKATLEAGYSTTVPDGASIVRITSAGDCVNSVDITLRLADCNLEGYVQAITTTTTSTTVAPTYCVSWTAANEGNIKMSTEGYIDFTAILAGRTIVGGLSAGTITGYVIAGMSPFTCSIPMTFTTSRAEWNTDTLPVETDKVLTSLIYTVEVIFNNSDEYFITDEQTNATVIPEQLTSSFDNCPVITTTTTTTI